MTGVLQCYDPEIVQYACDPRTGLPTKYKFPPEIFEVHDFCRERAAHLAAMTKYANWTKDADAEAKADRARGVPTNDQRPTREELMAKYPPNFGLGHPDRRPMCERLAEQGIPPAGQRPIPPQDVERHARSVQWLKDRREAAERGERLVGDEAEPVETLGQQPARAIERAVGPEPVLCDEATGEVYDGGASF